jgi:hypothetical protein
MYSDEDAWLILKEADDRPSGESEEHAYFGDSPPSQAISRQIRDAPWKPLGVGISRAAFCGCPTRHNRF